MKKCICILLSLLLALALVGCGGQSDTPAQSVDLKAAAEEAIASINSEDVVLFPEENPDAIESLYPNLTAVDTAQLVVYLPPIIGNPCEVVLVEVKNSGDVDTVRDILQNRIDVAGDDSAYPDNAAGWKNRAAVSVNGNYLVLSVLPEGVDAPDAFLAKF